MFRRFMGAVGVAAAVLVATAAGLTGSTTAEGATFSVTSTSCTGPGSIVEAIDQANANPGPDTISITSGLQIGPVNDTTCGTSLLDPALHYLAHVTEDVTVIGDNVRIWGNQKYVTFDGITDNPGKCPIPGFDTVLRHSPGFARIDANATLRVEGIRFENLGAFARVNDNAGLQLVDTFLYKIFDFYKSCDRPAIDAKANTDITIEDSTFFETLSGGGTDLGPIVPPFSQGPVVYWAVPTISGGGGGSLNIVGSSFEINGGTVQWKGGSVNVVSTRFGSGAGWINAYVGAVVNIVNSAFEGPLPSWGIRARIIADVNSTVNIKASTMVVGVSDCPIRGGVDPNAQCIGGPGVLQAKNGSTINLSESALGVQIDTGVPALAEYGGDITADERTWIQPLPGATPPQDAAALKVITDQPSLLTDPPGLAQGLKFWPESHTPLLGDTTTPGVLIDVIGDAECGNTNQLLSPIDNSCITTDVLGRSRWDTGNNRRNIGAIQDSLAPHLHVANVGGGSVDLSWSTLIGTTPTFTGYAVLYRPAGSSDPFTRIDVPDATTATRQVTGLTNGTTYEFQVLGVGSGVDGPTSNLVTATPSTVPGAPVVTPTPGDGQVALNWTVPNDGGSPLLGYVVQYRAVSASSWQSLPEPGTGSSATVTGLTNGTTYEFRVSAHNINGDGPFGPIAQATPTGQPTTTAPTTTTPLTPTPTVTPTLPATGSGGGTSTGIVAAMLLAIGFALVFTARRPDPR